MLNEYFDQIYCVTVHDFYDRHELVKTQLNGVKFKWVFAPPAKYLTPTPPLTTTETSLVLGHLNCVWDAKINGYKRIAIWEDDGVLIASQQDMGRFFAYLPTDWEGLYMANASWNEGVWHVYTTPLSEWVDRVTWGTGSGFNALQSHVYDIFIEEAMRFAEPVDYTYYKIFSRGNSYSPAKGFFSDPISVPNENALDKIKIPIDLSRYLPSRIRHGA